MNAKIQSNQFIESKKGCIIVYAQATLYNLIQEWPKRIPRYDKI